MAASRGFQKRKPALLDASSAIILYKCGLHDHLVNFYRVIITESVFLELTREDRDGSIQFERDRRESRMHVIINTGSDEECQLKFQAVTGLGAGERDTIMLYLRGIGDMIIIDDGKGAAYCKKNTIPYINALLVPRILYFGGRINKDYREQCMNNIIACGRYSHTIIEYARLCCDDDLNRFL
jgi:hypothetical protein